MNSLFYISILGTVAFAVSGGMVAIQSRMDLFGVNMLALTCAVGGGAIRDILIGERPVMFRDPTYVVIALITANVLFAFLALKHRRFPASVVNAYEKILFISDSLGLAAFTVNGVAIGKDQPDSTLFLCCFLGVITGIGGGILRDILARKMPGVFVKHIYAVASIIGAVITGVLWPVSSDIAMMAGFAAVVIIRICAAEGRWNLPHIEGIEGP